MFGFSGRTWAIIRFVFGIFGIAVVVAVVMATGVLSQLGAGLADDEPAQPSTAGGSSSSSTAGGSSSSSSSSSTAEEGTEGSFWDNVGAAEVIKGQIDRAASTGDCDTLTSLRKGYDHGGVILAGGVDAEADGGQTTREVQAYIAAEAIKAGCELD